MKRFALFAFAFILLVACDTPSAPTLQRPSLQATPPSFTKISNDKFDISGTITNPCPPAEEVAYQGSIHLLITGEETPTSSDLRAHINTQGISGVGLTSGDRYSILENVKEDFVSPAPGEYTAEVSVRFRMIRQGSNDNFWVLQVYRVSSSPPYVEIIREETECRG